MKVFITALDWGLGHTARVIPIVSQYKKAGHTIIIGCSKRQRLIFQQHFDDIAYIDLKSVSPRLSKGSSQTISWTIFALRFCFFTLKERRKAQKLHSTHNFDTIISDNRYGIRLKNCKSIIITHQLNLVLPKPLKVFSRLSNYWVQKKLNRFDLCLVPDIKNNENLAGKLSKANSILKTRVIHIGMLSRLELLKAEKTDKKDIVALISGPENQRTVFEDLMIQQLRKVKNKFSYVILGGNPGATIEEGNTTVINNISPGKLKHLLLEARYIFCRSGYSTLMDLATLNKTAYLVPTPGQSEQEYLAGYLSEKKWFLSCKQEEFNLTKALDQLNHFEPNAFPDQWAQKSNESFSI